MGDTKRTHKTYAISSGWDWVYVGIFFFHFTSATLDTLALTTRDVGRRPDARCVHTNGMDDCVIANLWLDVAYDSNSFAVNSLIFYLFGLVRVSISPYQSVYIYARAWEHRRASHRERRCEYDSVLCGTMFGYLWRYNLMRVVSTAWDGRMRIRCSLLAAALVSLWAPLCNERQTSKQCATPLWRWSLMMVGRTE